MRRFIIAALLLTVAGDLQAGPIRRFFAIRSAPAGNSFSASASTSMILPEDAPPSYQSDGHDQMVNALAEVNAWRARRGLPPFIEDPLLTIGAARVARYRAAYRIAGHANDFAFLPAGAMATSAGCAAWPVDLGWGSCCVDGNYRFAGASFAIGSDGLRYMHLFVR